MRCLSLPTSPLAFIVLPTAALTALAAQSELPEAPGKTAVKRMCGDCHEIGTVISARHTRIGWQQTVDDMVSRGAEGSDDDMAAVVAYLTEWFGKVNVNTASITELQKVLGASEKQARAITSYRDEHGKIKSFDELLKVPGVDPEKLQAKRSLIAFSQ